MKTAEEIFNDYVNIRTVGTEVAQNIIDAMVTYADQFKQKDDLLHHLTDEQLLAAMENYHREQTKQIPE